MALRVSEVVFYPFSWLLRWVSRLAQFLLRRMKQPIAVVTDVAQHVVGIVTAKDLVEEIVGELHAW